MPFDLRNIPSVFQRFIQNTLSEITGSFVQAYLDDIIILLIKNDLFVKLEKCEFHVFEMTFLGFTWTHYG